MIPTNLTASKIVANANGVETLDGHPIDRRKGVLVTDKSAMAELILDIKRGKIKAQDVKLMTPRSVGKSTTPTAEEIELNALIQKAVTSVRSISKKDMKIQRKKDRTAARSWRR